MDRIMNDGNDWDHVEGDAIVGPVDRVCRDELVTPLNEIKIRKDPWSFTCIIGVDCC